MSNTVARIPIKLFEYVAAGKPIIYGGTGVAAELLHQIGCAVTGTPEDPRAISAALAELLGDPEHMRVLGSGEGPAYARTFIVPR